MRTCWGAACRGWEQPVELNLPRSWPNFIASPLPHTFPRFCPLVLMGGGENWALWAQRGVCTRVCKAGPGCGLEWESKVLCRGVGGPAAPPQQHRPGCGCPDLLWGPTTQSHHLQGRRWQFGETPPRCCSTLGMAARLAELKRNWVFSNLPTLLSHPALILPKRR